MYFLNDYIYYKDGIYIKQYSEIQSVLQYLFPYLKLYQKRCLNQVSLQGTVLENIHNGAV